VLDRTPFFLDVVVKRLPDGLTVGSTVGTSDSPSGAVMAGGTALFRLDQFVNGVSYDRQYQALRAATAPDAGFLCQVMRTLLVVSHFDVSNFAKLNLSIRSNFQCCTASASLSIYCIPCVTSSAYVFGL
jgi:hypothetical protein